MQHRKPWRPDGARILRHAFFGTVQHSISIVVGLLLLPLLLARLGPERYGLLLTLQVLSMGGVLVYADAGLQSGLARFLTQHFVNRDGAEFRAFLSTGMAVFAVIGIVCALVVLAFGELLFFRVFPIPAEYARELRIAIYVYAASFLFQMPVLAVKGFYAGIQRLGLLRGWETAERVSYAGAVATLLLFSDRILHVVLVEQAVLLAMFAGGIVLARRTAPDLFALEPASVRLSRLRELWPISRQVMGNRLGFMAYQKGPELLIAALLGPVPLAWYGVIMKIPRALKGFSASAATFAGAAALDSLDLRDKLARLILRGARFIYLVMTPLFVFLLIFAPDLLRVWVGADYVHLAPLLRAALVWQFIMYFVFHVNSTFTRTEHFRRAVPWAIAANGLFLLIAAVGIRPFGLWGVMAGLLASAVLTAFGWTYGQFGEYAIAYRDLFRQIVQLPVLGVGAATMAVLLAVRPWLHGLTFLGLGTVLVLLYLVHAPLMYRVALLPAERSTVLRLVRRS